MKKLLIALIVLLLIAIPVYAERATKDGGGAIYGEVYYHNDSGTLDISTTTALTNVIGVVAGIAKGTTLNATNGSITIINPGSYKIESSMSVTSNGAETYHWITGVNGAAESKCHANRKIATPTDVGSASFTCIVALDAGDVVTLMVRSLANDTCEFEHFNLNISLIK
jgi:hypothetical protein